MRFDLRIATTCGTTTCSNGLVVSHLQGPPDLELVGSSIWPGSVCAHSRIRAALGRYGRATQPQELAALPALDSPALKRFDEMLTLELIRALGRLYVAEALLAGTTTIIDLHESPRCISGSLDAIAGACRELGARAVLSYGASEASGRAEGQLGLAECERFIRTGTSKTILGAVGLGASQSVSDDLVRDAGVLARDLGVVIHTSLAENLVDVEDAHDRGFAGPLERLVALGALPTGSVLAHGVHLSRDQVALVERHGGWLVQTPRSNDRGEVGYAESLTDCARVALGSDGWSPDLRLEMRSVREGLTIARARMEAGQRLAGELFGVGMNGEVGDAADLRVLDSRGQVCHVLVDGQVVVRDGRLVLGDMERIRAEAETAAERFWSRASTC